MTNGIQSVSLWRRCFRWKDVVQDVEALHSEQQAKIAELTGKLKSLEEEMEMSKGGNRTLLKFIMHAHHLNLK